VENNHTVPSVDTLEKLARALEVPMYRLFHDGQVEPSVRGFKQPDGDDRWGSKGREADYLAKLCSLLSKLNEKDQKLLLQVVQKVSR
jgi:transcriptional regulator with XRE-family HTH domain